MAKVYDYEVFLLRRAAQAGKVCAESLRAMGTSLEEVCVYTKEAQATLEKTVAKYDDYRARLQDLDGFCAECREAIECTDHEEMIRRRDALIEKMKDLKTKPL